jgi:hypothetical protein
LTFLAMRRGEPLGEHHADRAHGEMDRPWSERLEDSALSEYDLL